MIERIGCLAAVGGYRVGQCCRNLVGIDGPGVGWGWVVAMATEDSRSFGSLKPENVEAGLRKPEIMSSSGAGKVTDGFDVLNFIDFKWDVVSTKELRGHFLVSPKTCQVCGQTRPSFCFLYFCRTSGCTRAMGFTPRGVRWMRRDREW